MHSSLTESSEKAEKSGVIVSLVSHRRRYRPYLEATILSLAAARSPKIHPRDESANYFLHARKRVSSIINNGAFTPVKPYSILNAIPRRRKDKAGVTEGLFYLYNLHCSTVYVVYVCVCPCVCVCVCRGGRRLEFAR